MNRSSSISILTFTLLAALSGSVSGGESSVDVVDHISEIGTGDYYDFSDPVAIAESLPDCYKTEEGYKDCRPEFHPYQVAIDGTERIVDNFLVGEHSCRLDVNWKKFCTLPESLDGCWSFAKADLISAPPSRSAMQSRINLARDSGSPSTSYALHTQCSRK